MGASEPTGLVQMGARSFQQLAAPAEEPSLREELVNFHFEG